MGEKLEIKIKNIKSYGFYEDTYTETLIIKSEKIIYKKIYLDKNKKMKWEININDDIKKREIINSINLIFELSKTLAKSKYDVCDGDITTIELNNENEKIKIKTCINAFPRYVESFRKELKKYIPDDSFLPMFLY